MNNKMFIAMPIRDEARMDGLRMCIEGCHMFDRYGDARLAEKNNHFGFASVATEIKNGKTRWFRRMLGCSYVYMPCGWHNDETARKVFAWAEFLNKKVIFEEDGRCR